MLAKKGEVNFPTCIRMCDTTTLKEILIDDIGKDGRT